MKLSAKFLITSSALLVFGFLSFFVFAHAVPADKLNRVSGGMTENQIESMMGAPQYVRRESADHIAWGFGGLKRLRWCSAEIYFGADGRVKGNVFHDH